MRYEEFGGLQVRIAGGSDGRGGGDGPVVILLHGFGAPGNDLVPLWEALHVPAGTRFVFPVAPLSMNAYFGDSRAWWMLDVERMSREIAAGRVRDLSGEVPEGLVKAREHIIALLDDVERQLEVAPDKIVLGGFSQGAMLACDVALRTDRTLAGLVLLSGTLLARDEWMPLMPKRKGFRVIQSHGDSDPILPPSLAEQLRDLLEKAGLAVEWVGFEGGHELPPIVLQRLGDFLRKVLA